MINRELIRSKVVQTSYAFAQNEGKNAKVVEQELSLSCSKTHEMYMTLLVLLTEISRTAQLMHEVKVKRASRLGQYREFDPRFVKNGFLKQLEENAQLKAYRETMNEDLLTVAADTAHNLWKTIEESDYFQKYMKSRTPSYMEDRAICRQIYIREICENEALDDAFEDLGLYWNDDKAIVDTFVLKTISRFKEDSTTDMPLLTEYQKSEDREFAMDLLHYALDNSAYYDELIAANIQNWDLRRVALMDRVIMRVALAEIISFPTIPVSVSMNEYVELTKIFSTPDSWSFVNGTLDAIVKKLQAEHKIVKTPQEKK